MNVGCGEGVFLEGTRGRVAKRQDARPRAWSGDLKHVEWRLFRLFRDLLAEIN
jgi:hypothetical protein